MKTVNPFKVVFWFAAFIATVSFLSSCSSVKHGHNYSAHARKSKSVVSKAHHRNSGRDMVDFRCTNKH